MYTGLGPRSRGRWGHLGGVFPVLPHLRGLAGAGPALGVASYPRSLGVPPLPFAGVRPCLLLREGSLPPWRAGLSDQRQKHTPEGRAVSISPVVGESALCQELGEATVSSSPGLI